MTSPVAFKDIFFSLSDPNITKRDYDKNYAIITERIKEIWHYILEKSRRRYSIYKFTHTVDEESVRINETDRFCAFDATDWWNFQSEFMQEFDDQKELIVNKLYQNPVLSPNNFYKFHEGFPISLIWDYNWKENIEDHIRNSIIEYTKNRLEKYEKNRIAKQEKKERKKANNKKAQELETSIFNKTPTNEFYVFSAEEYNYIVSQIKGY